MSSVIGEEGNGPVIKVHSQMPLQKKKKNSHSREKLKNVLVQDLCECQLLGEIQKKLQRNKFDMVKFATLKIRT